MTIDLRAQGDMTQMTLDVLLPDSMSEQDVEAWLDSGMREDWPATIDRIVKEFANMGG